MYLMSDYQIIITYTLYRSIRNKLPYLELILSSNIYDVICLVETFLTNVNTDTLLLFGNPNYTIYRNGRNLIQVVKR